MGGSLAAPADELSRAGRDAVASARGARESAHELGTLLGLSIALIPSLPPLLLHVPARIAGARERRELTRAVALGRDPWVDELLARRALVHLPLRRLRAISDDPLADMHAGRHGELAAAELRWFRGRRRPARGAVSTRRPRFGRGVVALRWPIVLAWSAAAVLATRALPGAAG